MPQDLQGELDFRRDLPHRNIEPFGDLGVGQMFDAAREKYFASACRHFVEFRPENFQNLIAEQFVEQIVLGQRLDRRLCEPHVGGRKLPAHTDLPQIGAAAVAHAHIGIPPHVGFVRQLLSSLPDADEAVHDDILRRIHVPYVGERDVDETRIVFGKELSEILGIEYGAVVLQIEILCKDSFFCLHALLSNL